VLGRVAVPAAPRNVTATGDLRYLLVTSPQARTVSLVDSYTMRVVKVFRGFGRPLDVAVESWNAYVTDARRNELVVIDLVRRRIASRIVTHAPPNPYLTVVELGTPGPLRETVSRQAVPAVGGANDVSEQPDTAYAYVTGRRSGGVAGIDWGVGRPRWWRKVGSLVQHVAFDYVHGRRVWASDAARGEVLALSSETGRVLRRLGGCPGAGPIAMVPGFPSVVATCRDANALAIWDTRTGSRTLVPVGGRPHGVAVAVVP
jgi:DNA-binding beta-propeller fold protein YncE